jgi:hypothetical protein
LVVTGDNPRVENVVVLNATTSYDIDGDRGQFENCPSLDATAIGYDISGNENSFTNCDPTNTGVSARGYYISGATATANQIKNASSVGNALAGYEVVSGASFNVFKNCRSSGGDAKRKDNGTNTAWPDFIDILDTQVHEEILPKSTGQGDAAPGVTVGNTTEGGQAANYWGDTKRIVNPDTIPNFWITKGILIEAGNAHSWQWEILFTNPAFSQPQNGGAAWGVGATALTVADASIFQNGDFLWVTGDDVPDGEIVIVNGAPVGNVVNIVTETRLSAGSGLRYNYSVTPANNKLYLIKRSGDDNFTGFEGGFAAASSKDFLSQNWSQVRRIAANGGMIMRMLTVSAVAASSFDVRSRHQA